jgi:hypothetical protein
MFLDVQLLERKKIFLQVFGSFGSMSALCFQYQPHIQSF